MVFTEHELRRYKDYVIIVALGIVLGFISKIGIFTGIGMMFVLFFVVDLLMIPMGMLVARIMFKEVYPSKIEELKHTGKQYQYIAHINGKKIYSYVYKKPLDKVKIKVYTFGGRHLFEVHR